MTNGHRRRPGASFSSSLFISIVVLAFAAMLAAAASAQSTQGTQKPSSSTAQQGQKHDARQPAKGKAQGATATEPAKTAGQENKTGAQAPAEGTAPAGQNSTATSGQAPAAQSGGQGAAQSSGQAPQGGAQQPFVIPNQPMCPCPLVTKDPVEPRFQQICGRCHTPDRITAIKKSGNEWKETIDKMILKGAQVSDDDYDVILAFLVRNFDRVDINWVESGELVVALGLTPDEADKVVAYRKEHGDFKDFDALAKVPGIDAKKLEAKKSSIVFQ